MALENFIPEIWSARLLERLFKTHVFGQTAVINRDYEGEIRQAGDTVHIHSIGQVTIGDYTKNTDIDPPETLSDARRSLQITEAKYFNFQVDDVDIAQQTPKVMDGAMREAADGLADVADQFVAGLYVDVDAGNVMTGATPTADDAYEYLVDMGTLLDEANVPASGRWAVVPPWYHGLLLKDDRFVAAGTPTTDQTIRNGVIGDAAGFTILKSNNLVRTGSEDAVYHLLAGHPMAWSFAEQINKVEAYRPQLRFADAVKGLHLYGAKVTRPTALVTFPATRG